MNVSVSRAEISLIPSFRSCLDSVAKERVYIEMIEAPPLEKVIQFQTALIESGGPIAYATSGREVVGWCDIFPYSNERQRHRGALGMGLRKDYRGQGIGARLLGHALEQARVCGLEKVELFVYTSNLPAIALYERHGFVHEGLLKNYRKLDGKIFDCAAMAKFF